MLKGKTVVLGVTGSIAAYKAANLASMLVKLHADVHVIMTKNATNFIHPITFETLTNNKCLVDTFDRNFQYSVEHVALAKKADGTWSISFIWNQIIGKIVFRIFFFFKDEILDIMYTSPIFDDFINRKDNNSTKPELRHNIKLLRHPYVFSLSLSPER